MDERILAVAVGLFLLGNGTGFLANDLITDNRINDDEIIAVVKDPEDILQYK